MSVLVVGGGIFGVTAAISLRERGHDVTLIDRTLLPNSLSSSCDISKVIRLEYGGDIHYTQLMKKAINRWDQWNKEFGETLYHQTGLLILKQSKLQTMDFEKLSRNLVEKFGYTVQDINPKALREFYPAWNPELYVDGHYNPVGGWANSGRVIELLAKKAINLGVKVLVAEMDKLIIKNNVVLGVTTKDGKQLFAGKTLITCGSWTPVLLPHLSHVMKPTGQVVFHFQVEPKLLDKFSNPKFPTYAADVTKTGFYGFPSDNTGRLKIGHHGPGFQMKNVSPAEIESTLKEYEKSMEAEFRAFLAASLPDIKDAKIIFSRLCMYCDTFDGNFLIDSDPNYDGLYIAAGGSGHGFKFGPVLGDLIADSVENKPSPWRSKFKWRDPVANLKEEARLANKSKL
eukprot:TRINITY_DN8814_c0_g1_i2.p1 TRINITY_DN8814_c0_g1~~TRINITY_DN8814_c0_g1_i2.p1  ORF type:complete len:399 (+),score=110.29 TRINITY_DN8814_c0_g1_i2:17-1213(+)